MNEAEKRVVVHMVCSFAEEGKYIHVCSFCCFCDGRDYSVGYDELVCLMSTNDDR